MRFSRRRLLGLAASAAVGGVAWEAPAGSAASWGVPAGSFYASADGPAVNLVAVRGAGVPGYPPDDTQPVATPDGNVWRSSGFIEARVADYGIPVDAKAVTILVRAAITKGLHSSLASVFVFAVADPSCCQGPPQAPALPIDSSYGQKVRGMVLEAVAQNPGDGKRDQIEVTVGVRDGVFWWCWGYLRDSSFGDWQEGDAVGVALFIDGYYR